MIGAIARHISIVAGLAGSLATIVPGLLLWPRLSHSPFAGSSTAYYLLEMGLIGAGVLLAVLTRKALATPALWVACGLIGAFSFVAGLTIGGLYLPATVLFALSGLLADFSPVRQDPDTTPKGERRHRLRHLLLFGSAAVVQVAAMAGVAAMGR